MDVLIPEAPWLAMPATRTAPAHKERRTAPRYNLSLPIVSWAAVSKNGERCYGTTDNISCDGIYFATDRKFTPGSKLDFSLVLPEKLTGGIEATIHARGIVVRTERKSGAGALGMGTALVIEKLDIVHGKPAMS